MTRELMDSHIYCVSKGLSKSGSTSSEMIENIWLITTRILQILWLKYDHFGAGDAGVCIYRLKIKIISIDPGLILTFLFSSLLETYFCWAAIFLFCGVKYGFECGLLAGIILLAWLRGGFWRYIFRLSDWWLPIIDSFPSNEFEKIIFKRNILTINYSL